MIKDARSLRHVYTPNDVATYTMEVVEKRMAQRAAMLNTGIPTLDRYMRPVMPGELIFVSAFTSHGKTAFMQYWARNCVQQLGQREDINEMAVYITWETLVEELGLYDLCGMTGIDGTSAWYGDATDAEVQRLRVAAMKRSAMPLWVMGDSLKRRRTEGPLTVKGLSNSLATVEKEYGIRNLPVIRYHLKNVL
jgi:replicative DNA helicase